MKTIEQSPFAVQTTVRVSVEQVRNLLVGWFENGYSFWFSGVLIVPYRLPAGFTVEDFHAKGKMNPNNDWNPSQIIATTPGGAVILRVEEVETDERAFSDFILNIPAIQKGLQIMAEKYPRHFQDIIDENDDANTADIFGQCIVYGEEIFS